MRLIDADELKKKLRLVQDFIENYENILNAVFNLINNAPTVEPEITEKQAIDKLHETGWIVRHDMEMTERPQGEWIFVSRHCWKCPYCQELTNEGKNFCPNCGADMRGEK